MTDKQLDQLLQDSASQTPDLPPSFTQGVWKELERRRLLNDGRGSWLESLIELFALPMPRLAIWAVALGLGVFAGVRGGSKSADPVAVYAHSINPLAPAIRP